MSMQNNDMNELGLGNSELASLLKYAECGVCAYKVEAGRARQMMYMTDGFCKICEASREEIVAAYKRDRLFGIHDDFKEKIDSMITDTIISGEKHEMMYRAVSLRGTQKWCILRLNPEKRADGTMMLYGTFSDMTEYMQVQKDFTDLIQNIPGALCLFRFNGTYLEPIVVSDRYSEMIGTDAHEVLSKMRDMSFLHVHPEDLKQVQDEVYKALTQTHHMDYTYRSYNEKTRAYCWLNVQARAIPQEDGSVYAYAIYTDITRDKEIEQKLRASEQIIEVATTNAGVWYWNCKWRENVSYMGERFQKDFSLPAKIADFSETILKRGIVDSAYYEVFTSMCQKIRQGEKMASAVVRGYLSDGTQHWMEFRMSSIFNEKGIAEEAVGIMRLVDDMKELERKYTIEKQRSVEDKDLLAHACFNLSTREKIDYDGNYLFETYQEQESVEELGQAIARETLSTDIREQILRIHNRDFLLREYEKGTTEYSIEYQRKMASGKYVWVRSAFHLVSDPGSTDILLFEYCYDITLKKTINILTEYAVNEDFDLLGFVNMHDRKSIMVYGRHSYNPYGKNILEDDYQRSMLDFANNAVLEEDREWYIQTADLDNIQKCLKENESLEFFIHTRDEKQQVRSKKVYYTRYENDTNCYIFMQSDITQMVKEQKKVQEKLTQALKNAEVASNAKTSFLSQMSHEIRTPMNAIIGMTQLAKQTSDKQEMEKYLNQIDSSSQYLLGIINDILDMSRIESGKMELHPKWVDGSKLVLGCIEMLKPEVERKQIHFIYPKFDKNNNVRFYVDPLRMQQIYMNLLNNAVKFTPEGGTIEIVFKNIYKDSHSGIDQIQIRDTGCGMSREFLKRIFNPFEMEENPFSSMVQGTGLGLALVKAYVSKMNGKIWVESELGKGSVFTMEFPYEAKLVEDEEKDERQSELLNLQGKRILLVDDHPLNREIAKKLLEHQQAEVITAVDGQDACNIYLSAESYWFDAILMDIRMPKMNGLEATKAIRKMQKEDAKSIPIIAMTANAFDEDAKISLEAGMNEHLSKPIEPKKLMKTLSTYINK